MSTARPVPSLTRDQLASTLECSQAELGRLIRQRWAPPPVKINGSILWYQDEVDISREDITTQLARWRNARTHAAPKGEA